jgi:hypothetical protein
MNVIKVKTIHKNKELWINLDSVKLLYKTRDLSKDTWDVCYDCGFSWHSEEYESEEERDVRFEEVFAKWSGKYYLKEAK